jgi:hypothetical protein
MASSSDIQNILDEVQKAAFNAQASYTYKGKTYKLNEFNSTLIPLIQTELNTAKKSESVAKTKQQAAKNTTESQARSTRTALSRAEDLLATAKSTQKAQATNFANNQITSDQYKLYVDEVARLDGIVNQIKNGAEAVPVGYNDVRLLSPNTTSLPSVAPITNEAARIAATASQQSTADRLQSDVGLGETKKIITVNGQQMVETTHAGGGKSLSPASSAAAGTQVTTTTAGATSTTGTGAKTGKKTGAVTKPITPITDWEADLRKWVPSKSWMLELDRTKYPQLFTLLKTASEQKYYESDTGQKRFLAELDATDYFKELADSSQRRDIKALVGDLGFDSTDFTKFVSDSINFGWEGETLKAKTYEQVFARNVDGSYQNPLAVTRAKKSNDYLSVQLTAKAYFNNASAAAVENVLTGQVNTADFARQQRAIAKTRYGHLSELIDQGVTLEDLAANYKNSAAKLLEMDPNQIDMSQADFETALSFGDEGKKRTMTTGEWEKLLRTDQRYGWEKTNNAKTEARALASNIAQAFGKII